MLSVLNIIGNSVTLTSQQYINTVITKISTGALFILFSSNVARLQSFLGQYHFDHLKTGHQHDNEKF